jgi:hypothetical protein
VQLVIFSKVIGSVVKRLDRSTGTAFNHRHSTHTNKGTIEDGEEMIPLLQGPPAEDIRFFEALAQIVGE